MAGAILQTVSCTLLDCAPIMVIEPVPMELQKTVVGKKIVFVHPPELVSKHLIDFLTDKEYEVYILQDHTKIKWINSSYPGTIFFLNIDTALNEYEWEEFIQNLRRENQDLQLGILSFKITDNARIQHYVMDLGVNCGFIQMKQGVKAARDLMLKTLQRNEAKGRRKYVRYECRGQATLNLKSGDDQINGGILDISSVGMAFTLNKYTKLVKNQLIRDIQLQLKGVLVSTHGVLVGQRIVEGKPLFVVLFKSPDLQKVREKIRSYIHSSLQREFDEEFT
jgi:hypothetical protein